MKNFFCIICIFLCATGCGKIRESAEEVRDVFGNVWDDDMINRFCPLPEGKWTQPVSDKFGFLWTGGKKGLIRFDPRKPEKGWITFEANKDYPGGAVRSMSISPGGMLWVEPVSGGSFEVDVDNKGGQIVVKEPVTAVADKVWKTLSHIPYASHDVYGAEVDGKIYIPGGGAPHGMPPVMTNFDRMLVYDTNRDSWRTTSPMHLNRRYCNVGQIDGKIWVIGGFVKTNDVETPTNTVEIYDPQTDAWIWGPILHKPCAESVTGVINNRLYVVYSLNRNLESYTQSITSGEQDWRMETPPPHPIFQTDGCVFDDELYVMIPRIGLIKYDPVAQTWETDFPPFPGSQAPRAATIVAHKGQIWVISGTDVADGNRVLSYHPAERKWEEKQPFPQTTLWASGLDVNGKLDVFGGATFSNRHQIFTFWNTIRQLSE